MSPRGIDARVDHLDAVLGHNRSVFRRADGRRMYVPTATVLRAFFNWIGGEAMDLDPRISYFLANAVAATRSADFEVALIEACREQYAVPSDRSSEPVDAPPDLPDDV